MTLPNQQHYKPQEVASSEAAAPLSSAQQFEDATAESILSQQGLKEDIVAASKYLKTDCKWHALKSAFELPRSPATNQPSFTQELMKHDSEPPEVKALVDELTSVLSHSLHAADLVPKYTAALHSALHSQTDMHAMNPPPPPTLTQSSSSQASSNSSWGKKSGAKKRSNLSSDAKRVLRAWFDAHFHHPYPTEEEKERLRADGGITLDQVNNWFINTRVREWKPKLHQILADSDKGDRSRLEEMLVKVKAPYEQATLI